MSVDTARVAPSTQAIEDRDDIATYIDTLDASERNELAAASATIDLGILLYRIRAHRGLSQAAAARLAGLHQQAVSRFERPDAQPRLDTVQSYLGALGYAVKLSVVDLRDEPGSTIASITLPPPSQ